MKTVKIVALLVVILVATSSCITVTARAPDYLYVDSCYGDSWFGLTVTKNSPEIINTYSGWLEANGAVYPLEHNQPGISGEYTFHGRIKPQDGEIRFRYRFFYETGTGVVPSPTSSHAVYRPTPGYYVKPMLPLSWDSPYVDEIDLQQFPNAEQRDLWLQSFGLSNLLEYPTTFRRFVILDDLYNATTGTVIRSFVVNVKNFSDGPIVIQGAQLRVPGSQTAYAGNLTVDLSAFPHTLAQGESTSVQLTYTVQAGGTDHDLADLFITYYYTATPEGLCDLGPIRISASLGPNPG